MMKTFVLIMVISNTSVATAEFDSFKACSNAGQMFMTISGASAWAKYACVQKQ